MCWCRLLEFRRDGLLLPVKYVVRLLLALSFFFLFRLLRQLMILATLQLFYCSMRIRWTKDGRHSPAFISKLGFSSLEGSSQSELYILLDSSDSAQIITLIFIKPIHKLVATL